MTVKRTEREVADMVPREAPTRSAAGSGTGTRGTPQRWLTVVVVLGAVQFLVFGVWAFFWPHSFYESIATFPPFNLHLIHDAGAFQLGIAAAIIGGLIWRDGLLVGLVGGMVGTTIHAISHFLDVDLGGRASDPYTLSVLALLLVIATVARARAVRR